MNAFITLFTTEAKLAIRGGDMLFFGVAFPVGIMLLFGFISSAEALPLAFGGVAAIGICASGLMGLPLTFAAYRHEKILKRLKVTPASPILLLLSVALVQALFALISCAAVLIIAQSFFGMTMTGSLGRYLGTFLFVQISVYGIGFLIAALAPNVKMANLLCTLIYFPTLLLSGTTIPFEILPQALRAFSTVFPLTEGIKLLKGAVLGLDPALDVVRFAVLAAIAVVSYVVAIAAFRWE